MGLLTMLHDREQAQFCYRFLVLFEPAPVVDVAGAQGGRATALLAKALEAMKKCIVYS